LGFLSSRGRFRQRLGRLVDLRVARLHRLRQRVGCGCGCEG
jgi:hypothetical protein